MHVNEYISFVEHAGERRFMSKRSRAGVTHSAILFAAFLLISLLAAPAWPDDTLGDSAKKSGRPLVVDFGQNLCKQCIKQSEAMELFRKAAGKDVDTRFVHVVKEAELTASSKIMLIPTLLFFDRKGNEVYRQVGYMPFDEMMAKAKELGFTGGRKAE